MKKLFVLMGLLVIAALVLPACAPGGGAPDCNSEDVFCAALVTDVRHPPRPRRAEQRADGGRGEEKPDDFGPAAELVPSQHGKSPRAKPPKARRTVRTRRRCLSASASPHGRGETSIS